MGNQVHSFEIGMSAERIMWVIKKGYDGIDTLCH